MGSIEGQGTHVLMVALAYQGHLNPMLKFIKHVARPNLHFTLATTEQARDLLSDATDEPNRPVDLVFFSDGLPKHDPRTPGTMTESLRRCGPKNLSEILKGKKFSCIISVPFTPWVPAIAAAHNIPCAILWIGACGVFSVYYRYYMKSNSFPDLEDLNQTVKLPGLPLLEVKDLPSLLLPSNGANFNTLMGEFVDCLKDVKWVLANSFYELESEVIKTMSHLKPIIPIGPLVSPVLFEAEDDKITLDMWKSDDDCMKWLDKQVRSSVLFISFGSILKCSENQVKSIAMALKNKGVSFLWILRPKEKGENVNVLKEMVKEGKGVVIEWTQQEKILSHEASLALLLIVDGILTIETVVTGFPVIAYPSWTDQPFDARLLVDVFGIGIRMRDDIDGELKVAEVGRCIEAVTEGSSAVEMRKRATELKQAARLAMAPGGSSARNLELFIKDIKIVN